MNTCRPRGAYTPDTICCGGGFVGYTTRAADPRGISTQTSEHQQVVYQVYTPSGHGSYVIYYVEFDEVYMPDIKPPVTMIT